MKLRVSKNSLTLKKLSTAYLSPRDKDTTRIVGNEIPAIERV